jgi:hypothetical protein
MYKTESGATENQALSWMHNNNIWRVTMHPNLSSTLLMYFCAKSAAPRPPLWGDGGNPVTDQTSALEAMR